MTGLDTWYGYMKSQDGKALWDLLHPDAVFDRSIPSSLRLGTEKYHAVFLFDGNDRLAIL